MEITENLFTRALNERQAKKTKKARAYRIIKEGGEGLKSFKRGTDDRMWIDNTFTTLKQKLEETNGKTRQRTNKTRND